MSKEAQMESRWIGTKEAAAYMSVNPQMVKRWTREGRISGQGVGRAGRTYRFKLEALDRFIHQNEIKRKRR